MEGDNPGDVLPKNQPALGDITNRLGKRGLTLISSNSGDKIVDDKGGNSQFTKRVCLGVENIIKEKCAVPSIGNENDKKKRACVSLRPCSEISSLRENVISGLSKGSEEIKESVSSLQIGRDNVAIHNVGEVDEATGDSCISGTLLPIATGTSSGVKENWDKDEEQDPLNVVEGCSQTEESVPEICGKDMEGIPVGNLTTGKHGMVELSAEHDLHVPASFKLEKCKGLMGDSCSNSSAGIDLLKSCSCSFCVKAAYIWSDLHYQDIRGRISALKKSQREANIMRERSCRNKGIDKLSQGNHYNVSKLESDLTGQWRSLFLHMENIFECEGNQLEASLLQLKDLRDNCKTDLEMVNGMPREKH